jgi:N-acetylmuramoyl-L-alanine amidase
LDNRSPWPPLAVSLRSESGNAVLTFTHSSRKITSFWLTDPPRYVVDFYFGGSDPSEPTPIDTGAAVITTRPPAVTPAGGPKPPPAPGKRFLIVVDAGHGGHDPGASGNSLLEKNINLKAAQELAADLRAAGFDVRESRTDDRYLKLAERTAFANDNNADVFISLHCNALPKGQHASGTELYLMAEHTDNDALNLAVMENRELSGDAQNASEINAAADRRTMLLLKILGDMQQSDKLSESTTLAESIYNRMNGAGFAIRKVRQAPFFVLRGAGMPALLIEMGYITEARDAKNLNSQAYRKKMMAAITAGIANYLKSGSKEGIY